MRVLVFGASGFVGHHLMQYLKSFPGHSVQAASRDNLGEVLSRDKYDIIVNLASNSSVEQSVKEPSQIIKNNIDATLWPLEYARENDCRLYIHLSSVEIYNITNPYAASKAAQEKIIESYVRSFSIPAIILRSTNIVGSGQSDEKFVPKIVKKIKNHEVVELYSAAGRKASSRTYVAVNEVCSAIAWLLEYEPQMEYGELLKLDLDSGETLTNYQMARRIASLLGKKLHYEYVNPGHVRPAYAPEFIQRGKKLSSLGWKPKYNLSTGLQWIKQQ